MGWGAARFGWVATASMLTGPVSAQIPLYAQRLPPGTVYIRLVNALPGPASVLAEFAGKVALGAEGAARVSPYFVSTTAGGRTVELQVDEAGQTSRPHFQPQSGSFVTIVLHGEGGAVTAAMITDKPEYNQLRARLAFYNATADCPAARLAETSGPVIFSNVAPDGVAARGINPVAAQVVAGCGGGTAPGLDLGPLEAGGLYTVWLMRMEGSLAAFLAHDTIAPPRR